MKKMPKSSGRPRKRNYTEVRELFAHRRSSDPGYSKAALGRELGLSTRTVRGILNCTYEKRYMSLKAERLQEKESDEDEHCPRGTLMVGMVPWL